jgi:acetylornithine deacetylase/succinyl-diaminopimelate desuccinylase-like protein
MSFDCRASACFRCIQPRAWLAAGVLFFAGVPVVALAALSADEQAIVRYVDAHAAGYAADLERAVLIDSPTQNLAGVKRVGAFYRAQFDALGFTTRWIDFPAEMKRAGHLFAERTGTRGSRLLLIGHLDTVLPGGKFVRDASLIAGGTEASLDDLGAQATGKNNVVPQRAVVRGDLRFVSAAQLAHARERMRAIVTAGNLRRTSATIKFFDRYPAMEITPANLALLARLSEISVALGHDKLEAGDPKTRGAGDVSFVAPFLPAIDGLGASGHGAHAPTEDVDLATLPLLVQRTAILIYRLTR